jgi:lipoprotein-anchoring transpeptidase ErfK/SrfK
MRGAITRRYFLGATAVLAATGALAQPATPPYYLPPGPRPPLPIEPRTDPRYEPRFDPRAAPPQVQRQPQQPGQQVTEEDWFLDPVADGPFQYRKVNFELLDPEFRRQLVSVRIAEEPGTLVVDPRHHFLYSMRERGEAIRYGVGVGREGFGWSGRAMVGRKQEWPDWHPPKEMRLRQPELPEKMPGGPGNPLGARALYLFEGNRDTLYRIHGTAEPWTIGTDVSSGCIRMLNEEVIDLYLRTPIGTRVVVL